MDIVILTGDEIRHEYVRKKIASHSGINVLRTYCESAERSLKNRIDQDQNSSILEKHHIDARMQSEEDFFGDAIFAMPDYSNPRKIKKGAINSEDISSAICALQPDLLICYGASLIKSSLLDRFKGRFLNVHLGLSPYYRGSGTNIWPLINDEPHMVGATFMHIDAGIDTGAIIHQIRADIFLGDGPHSIGNRLIKKMAEIYCHIICSFDNLAEENQPKGKNILYLRKHFDSKACSTLYHNFQNGMISNYLRARNSINLPYIVCNSGLSAV
ncbi:MAG: formyltransferase family protein [Bacteroidota bacterium]